MSERAIFDESDQRLVLAGLARAAWHYEDKGDQDEADRFWTVRDAFVDAIGPKGRPLEDVVIVRQSEHSDE